MNKVYTFFSAFSINIYIVLLGETSNSVLHHNLEHKISWCDSKGLWGFFSYVCTSYTVTLTKMSFHICSSLNVQNLIFSHYSSTACRAVNRKAGTSCWNNKCDYNVELAHGECCTSPKDLQMEYVKLAKKTILNIPICSHAEGL